MKESAFNGQISHWKETLKTIGQCNPIQRSEDPEKSNQLYRVNYAILLPSDGMPIFGLRSMPCPNLYSQRHCRHWTSSWRPTMTCVWAIWVCRRLAFQGRWPPSDVFSDKKPHGSLEVLALILNTQWKDIAIVWHLNSVHLQGRNEPKALKRPNFARYCSVPSFLEWLEARWHAFSATPTLPVPLRLISEGH